MSLSQSRIVNQDEDNSFEVDLDDIIRQTDQSVLAKVIGQSLERNTGGQKNSKLGFSQKQLPKKLSAKLSENVVNYPYGTPNKASYGNIGKSFEFSSEDTKEILDKVESLATDSLVVSEKKSGSNNAKPRAYQSLEEALRRPSVLTKTSSVIQLTRLPTLADRLMVLQGQRRRESLVTDDLIPAKKETEQIDVEEIQHLTGAIQRI